MQGQIPKDFFDKKDNMEEGNIHLLTKVNQMLDGSLMKYWKSIQETKIWIIHLYSKTIKTHL